MKEPSDIELVQQVRGGDRQAFTKLIHRYQERVYRLARRLVGFHEEADEIAQEAFVRAFLALGDFRNDAIFFTWLYRIAVNLSLNAMRRRQLIAYIQDSEILRRFLPEKEQPDRQEEFRKSRSSLERAVASLPEKQRVVFVLRFHDQLAYGDVSEILKTSAGGLRTNYVQALHRVREYLKNETEADKECTERS